MRRKRRIKASIKREIKDFVKTFLITAVCVFVCANFIVRPVKVKGSSMYPTLQDSEYGFSNIIGTKISKLNRFDIVVIYIPEKKEYIVKRVIGLPNEKVSYVDDQLYINDQPVEEPFLNTEYKNSYDGTFTDGVLETTLGDDEYYCLGDNRPNSKDSRYYGPFSANNISSKGILILWPLQSINLLTW